MPSAGDVFPAAPPGRQDVFHSAPADEAVAARGGQTKKHLRIIFPDHLAAEQGDLGMGHRPITIRRSDHDPRRRRRYLELFQVQINIVVGSQRKLPEAKSRMRQHPAVHLFVDLHYGAAVRRGILRDPYQGFQLPARLILSEGGRQRQYDKSDRSGDYPMNR